MRYLILVLACSCFSLQLNAQQPDAKQAPYLQFPTAPPFKLLLPDSTTVYTRDDLHDKKSLLLILFSPECDHCRHMTDSLIAHIDRFKNVQIVMATVLPFERLQKFHTEYKLDQYPNIIAGRDFQFLLPAFFQSHSLPVLGFYDRKKKLLGLTEGALTIDLILSKLRK